MRISLQKALSFYLTGRVVLPDETIFSESGPTKLTKQELDDMEISSQEEYKKSEEKSFQFSSPVFNLKADFNTVHGQLRMCGLGVINSFFSGIGASFGDKINFLSGLGLAALALGTSFFKKPPILTTKYSILSFGGNLIRGPLHVLDSIFSIVGEHGAKYKLPSLFASAISLFSLHRTLEGSDSKSFELPFDTVSGTLGRTAIHHMDSMLASKATQLSNENQRVSSFLASALTTLGLLLPSNLRKKKIPWNTHEGFIAQGGSNFIDSLFSNVGNVFTSTLSNTKRIALCTSGVVLGMPFLGSLLNSWNYQVPFGTLEGRLIRGIFHAPENFVFNLGTTLGNSAIGIPLSLGFLGMTYTTCLSKSGNKLLKNFQISRDKIGGLIQRLPFQLIYSTISASGIKISKFLPAPLLMALGPALSFQIGEKFKNIDTKFDDFKGLMLRNSVHFWETILARAAYRTGRKLTGTEEQDTNSGSILSDGRWLSDDGRIVPSMAIGKQRTGDTQNNLLSVLFSAVGGAVFTLGTYFASKCFIAPERKTRELAPEDLSEKQQSAFLPTPPVAEGSNLCKARWACPRDSKSEGRRFIKVEKNDAVSKIVKYLNYPDYVGETVKKPVEAWLAKPLSSKLRTGKLVGV